MIDLPNPRASGRGLLLLALVASGCGHSLPWAGLPAHPVALVSPSLYPRDAAVVLTQEDRRLMVLGYSTAAFTEEQRHEVRQILTEAGFDHADVRIPMRKRTELRMLEARTIAPDGTIHPVDARAILSDEARLGPDDDDQVRVKIFRFPNVQVGSRLEFAYTVRTPVWYGTIFHVVGDDLPVRHYHLDFRCTPEIRYALRAYNTGAQFQVTRRGGLDRIELTIDNTPGDEWERYTPPRIARVPYWLFRTKQVWLGTNIHSVAIDWPHAFEREAKALYVDPGKLLEGADLAFPGAHLDDPLARVAHALDYVRDKVELIQARTGDRPRRLKTVLSAGNATEDERALLIFHLLAHVGLSPRMAFLHGALGGVPDKTFPSSAYVLDQLLIDLPAQRGLPATWIDPGCEACGPGVVRARYVGGEALEVWMDRGVVRDDPRAEFVRIEARPGPAASSELAYQVEVQPGGDGSGTVLDVERGSLATGWRFQTRAQRAEDLLRDARKAFARSFATATLDDAPPPEFDRAHGVGRQALRIRLPGYATPDAGGERLLVPLSILRTRWDELLKDEQRFYPLEVRQPERLEETLTLQLPPGFRLVEQPADVRIDGPLLQAELAVKAEGEGSRVVVRRSLRVQQGTWPASAYEPLRRSAQAYTELRKKVLVLARTPTAAPPPVTPPLRAPAAASPAVASPVVPAR